jgi:imidazolonepropionase
MSNAKIIGPFHQILTMDGLSPRGPIKDDELEILSQKSILIVDGEFTAIGSWDELTSTHPDAIQEKLEGNYVATPGFIDCHTHICFGGNRARDYALRNSGSTYLEIAAAGGGIWDTVTQTRNSSQKELIEGILVRGNKLLANGVTTIEVKSGYGLSVTEELKMLEAINIANKSIDAHLIPTCLAAHIVPKEYKTSPETYVQLIIEELFPQLVKRKLARRVDAFVEEEAYNAKIIAPYMEAAQQMGLDITIHADQFHTGGTALAVKYNAVSADHLEASTDIEIQLLKNSDVIPVALPGASLGLGCDFTPARRLLDAGTSLAIASDYNPGSAPMGDLLTQASILGAFEKLSNAEVLAGITCRAADALKEEKIGKIATGFHADLAIFKTNNYQNLLYFQGQLKPKIVISKGKMIKKNNHA